MDEGKNEGKKERERKKKKSLIFTLTLELSLALRTSHFVMVPFGPVPTKELIGTCRIEARCRAAGPARSNDMRFSLSSFYFFFLLFFFQKKKRNLLENGKFASAVDDRGPRRPASTDGFPSESRVEGT